MLDIILIKLVPNLVFGLLNVVKLQNISDILLLHLTNGSNDVDRLLLWQHESSLKLFQGHSLGHVCVLYLNQLSWVNESIHIVCSCKWSWHGMAWSIESLWKSILSFSSHHFFNYYLSCLTYIEYMSSEVHFKQRMSIIWISF